MEKSSRKPPSAPPNGFASDERNQSEPHGLSLPPHVAGSGALDRLVETARDYARQAVSENTVKAYAKDWAQFARWCRMRGTDPLPPSPELIGLYIADLAAPQGKAPGVADPVTAYDDTDIRTRSNLSFPTRLRRVDVPNTNAAPLVQSALLLPTPTLLAQNFNTSGASLCG